VAVGQFAVGARLGLGILALLGTGACAVQDERPATAVRGVLDLTAWQPRIGGNFRLDGEWRYYPRQLLAPGDLELAGTPPGYQRVPEPWDDRATEPGDPRGHGFATYALTVRLPPDVPLLALRLPTIATAFQLFADGFPVASAGLVGETADRADPAFRPQVHYLAPTVDRTLDLIVQVSNFHYAQGGLWEPIWIGTPNAISRAREMRIVLATFLAGAFSVFGLSHLMLWATRRRDWAMLYFAVVCLGMALRVVTTEEVVVVDLMPSLSWASLVRIEYASICILVAATALFLWRLFPSEMPRSLALAFTYGSIAGLLLIGFLSPAHFSPGFRLLQGLSLTAAAVGTFCIGLALVRRRDGAALFLIGLLAILATGLHDLMVSLYPWLPSTHWAVANLRLQSVGLFILILSQAAVIARRTGQTVTALEARTQELRAAHEALDVHAHELEQKVAQRTTDLERANRRLIRLAEIDGLTKVGNRRFFDEELRRSWFDHLRREAPLSLLLIDVDCFKLYNDRYGHLAGDQALRQVAATVAETAKRPRDIVARYGGEELVVLLADTELAGARHLAEKVRHSVAQAAIAHEASEVVPWITVSVGVASVVPRDDLERTALVDDADQALYRAKQQGRNQVVAAA